MRLLDCINTQQIYIHIGKCTYLYISIACKRDTYIHVIELSSLKRQQLYGGSKRFANLCAVTIHELT